MMDINFYCLFFCKKTYILACKELLYRKIMIENLRITDRRQAKNLL